MKFRGVFDQLTALIPGRAYLTGVQELEAGAGVFAGAVVLAPLGDAK